MSKSKLAIEKNDDKIKSMIMFLQNHGMESALPPREVGPRDENKVCKEQGIGNNVSDVKPTAMFAFIQDRSGKRGKKTPKRKTCPPTMTLAPRKRRTVAKGSTRAEPLLFSYHPIHLV